MSKYKEIEVDLSDFETDEIIEHLEFGDELTPEQTKRLKTLIDDNEEEFSEKVLNENQLYQSVIQVKTLINRMKLDVILANLDNVSYEKVCEIFENK